MLTKKDLSVEITYNGINISCVVHGYRVSRKYIGYTKREAIRLFLAEVNHPGN